MLPFWLRILMDDRVDDSVGSALANGEAAGCGERDRGPSTEHVRCWSNCSAREIPTAVRVPILSSYLRRWKFETGLFFDDVTPDSTDEEWAAVAARNPSSPSAAERRRGRIWPYLHHRCNRTQFSHFLSSWLHGHSRDFDPEQDRKKQFLAICAGYPTHRGPERTGVSPIPKSLLIAVSEDTLELQGTYA